MATIPEYTRGIIRQRQTPDAFNLGAIQDAGSVMRGVSTAADFGAQIAIAHERANEATAVNDAIIAKQKEDLEYLDTVRKQNENNPFGFAKRIEPEMEKRDAERAKALPSERARKAYLETSKRLNLGIYEGNFNWENTRKTQIYAGRVQNSLDNINLLALRAGREGRPIEDVFKDVDATTAAAGGVLSTDKLMQINQSGRSDAAAFWIDGMVGQNPYQAKDALDSGKYDTALGASRLASAYGKAEAEIKRREKEVAEAQSVADLLAGNRLADPSNKDDRKLVNSMYINAGILERFQAGDAEAVKATTTLIKQTSIIPESVQSTLRGYMSNGNTEQKKMAYSFVSQIEEINPAAVTGAGGFTEKEIKDAAAYNSLLRSGATPSFAEQSLAQANSPLTADVRSMRNGELTTIMKDFTPERIKDEYGKGWFTLNPDFMGTQAQAKAFADYKNIFKEAYMQHGSEEVAHSVAMAAVRVNNGETYVTGGKKLMAFPPEQYYGVPNLSIKENAKWMQTELKNDLAGFGYSGELEKVTLVPTLDSKAIIDGGGKPLYNAIIEVERDGMPFMDILRDEKNQPVKIGFDTARRTLTEAKKREEDVMGAKAKRVTNYAAEELELHPLTEFAVKKAMQLKIDMEIGQRKEQKEQFYGRPSPKMIEDQGGKNISDRFKVNMRRAE
jgi:hypothetical protein